MTTFKITAKWNAPYPKEKEYRIEGSSFTVSTGKAIRQWKKEELGKGRRFNRVDLSIEKLV